MQIFEDDEQPSSTVEARKRIDQVLHQQAPVPVGGTEVANRFAQPL